MTSARARIAILVATALVYALATQLPLPGLDPGFLANGWQARWMTRLSLASLGVTPFVSAVLLFEIARLAAPPLARWAASPADADRCETIVWALALVLGALQGFAVARGIEAARARSPRRARRSKEWSSRRRSARRRSSARWRASCGAPARATGS
jgi:preprotein translocase subunit SecY